MGVGVLGGAFDPPHLGHLALARAGVRHFGLVRLLVRVVAAPGHRGVTAPSGLRLELARLAFAELPVAEVALDHHARTVDSLLDLGLEDPVFLVGADELAAFASWKEPERVLELARLGVGRRPGVAASAIDAALAGLGRRDRVEVFEIEQVDVSSTAVRAKLAAGEPVDGLVPGAVAEALAHAGAYREL